MPQEYYTNGSDYMPGGDIDENRKRFLDLQNALHEEAARQAQINNIKQSLWQEKAKEIVNYPVEPMYGEDPLATASIEPSVAQPDTAGPALAYEPSNLIPITGPAPSVLNVYHPDGPHSNTSLGRTIAGESKLAQISAETRRRQEEEAQALQNASMLGELGKGIYRGAVTTPLVGIGGVVKAIGENTGWEGAANAGDWMRQKAQALETSTGFGRNPLLYKGDFTDNPSFARAAGHVGEGLGSLADILIGSKGIGAAAKGIGAGMQIASLVNKADTIGKVGGLVGFGGLPAGGQTYVEAREKGYTPGEAAAVGAADAAWNTATDWIGLEGVTGRLTPYLTKSFPGMTKLAGGVVGRGVTGALTEGGEELGQQIGSNILAQMTYDPKREWNEGALENFIGGAGAGGIMGAGHRALMGPTIQSAQEQAKITPEVGKIDQTSQNQEQAIWDADQQRILQDIQNKIKQNKQEGVSQGIMAAHDFVNAPLPTWGQDYQNIINPIINPMFIQPMLQEDNQSNVLTVGNRSPVAPTSTGVVNFDELMRPDKYVVGDLANVPVTPIDTEIAPNKSAVADQIAKMKLLAAQKSIDAKAGVAPANYEVDGDQGKTDLANKVWDMQLQRGEPIQITNENGKLIEGIFLRYGVKDDVPKIYFQDNAGNPRETSVNVRGADVSRIQPTLPYAPIDQTQVMNNFKDEALQDKAQSLQLQPGDTIEFTNAKGEVRKGTFLRYSMKDNAPKLYYKDLDPLRRGRETSVNFEDVIVNNVIPIETEKKKR